MFKIKAQASSYNVVNERIGQGSTWLTRGYKIMSGSARKAQAQ